MVVVVVVVVLVLVLVTSSRSSSSSSRSSSSRVSSRTSSSISSSYSSSTITRIGGGRSPTLNKFQGYLRVFGDGADDSGLLKNWILRSGFLG